MEPERNERMRSISNSSRVTFAEGQGRWWGWRSCVLPAGVMMEKAEELMPRGVPYVRNKADAAAKGTREPPVARPHCREYHAGSWHRAILEADR